MKSMCKHWGLHISTNINCPSAVLGSFWAVWKGLLWCLKAKLRLWRFPRYWRFNKWYHGGYQLICLISWPLLIASGRDWYWSKGLLKGFKLALRPWESSKNRWRYGWMKFVTPVLHTFQTWPCDPTPPPYFTPAHHSPNPELASFYSEYGLETHDSVS